MTEKLIGQATVNGLEIKADVITDEDELMDRFNANMILARVLVVKLMLKNQNSEPIDLHRLRFELRDRRDQKYKYLKPRKAVEQLYDYYEINTYLIAARKEVEAEFAQEALQTEGKLLLSKERQGLIFFEIPKAVDKFDPLDDLTLRLERLRWPTSNRKMTIEVPLSR